MIRLRPLLPGIAAILGSIGFASGTQAQTTAPSGAPLQTAPGAEPPVSVEATLAEALKEIAVAEKKGPDATEAIQKASQLASYVLASDPVNPRAGFIVARVLLLQGRLREALGYLNRYVESREGKTDWLGFKLIGDIYLGGKYYSMARTKYLRALELSPNQRDANVGLATTEIELMMYDEAHKHAQRGVELNDKDPVPTPHAVLASALMKLNRYDEAITAAGRAVDLARAKVRSAPADISPLRLLDELLKLQEDVVTAKQSAFPEQPEVYLALARVIEERSDVARLLAYHQALNRLLVGVRSTGPNASAELLYETARLQYAVGQTTEALETVRKALEKNADHAEADKLRQRIESEQTTP